MDGREDGGDSGADQENNHIEIDDFPSYKPPFIKDFPWLCQITRWAGV